MITAIARAKRRHGFRLIAWVIMPGHVHLLVVLPPGLAWSVVASAIKNPVAKGALASMRRRGDPILGRLRVADGTFRFWQHGGGFDRNVRDEYELLETIRYIHRNPVERGLVADAAAWSASSVRWWMGVREGEVECDLPRMRGVEDWKGYV